MTPKYRFTFSLLMSLVLSFLMTAWVTWINLGFAEGFLWKWGTAFATAWPAAAIISFVFGPKIHQLTNRLLDQ